MKNHDIKKSAVLELNRISKKNKGKITPDAVVDSARNPHSPLHPCFEWDDSIAGDLYRLGQARELIRSCAYSITTEVRTVKAPYYTRDPDLDPSEQGYIETKLLPTKADLARKSMEAELARLESILARANAYAMVLGLGDSLQDVSDAITKAREQLFTANLKSAA